VRKGKRVIGENGGTNIFDATVRAAQSEAREHADFETAMKSPDGLGLKS
jgi:hypothetical protein